MVGVHALEEHYNLEDALVIAGFLNCFVRNADIVKMANMAQLVNVIAPIFVENDKMYLQTIYYPLQMFANNMKGGALFEMLEWYCDYMDSLEDYTPEERENFDVVCTMIVNILTLPMDVFSDMNYCMDVAHDILTRRAAYYNKLADEAEKESEESVDSAIADAAFEAEQELGKELAGELHALAEKDKMKS